MKFTAIVLIILVSIIVSSACSYPGHGSSYALVPAAGDIAKSTGPLATQHVSGQIIATVSQIVSSPATYGSFITFGTIAGLTAGDAVAANSTEIVDSSGATIVCSNSAYAASSSGTLSGLEVQVLGNASSGPFALFGQAGNSSFTVDQAGISSIPSSLGSSIFVFPRSQSPGGTVSIYGADFAANQSLGYPVVGNQSYPGVQGGVADVNGAFHVSFQLSDMSAGQYTVRMSGAIRATVNLTVVPFMSLIPSFGHVGQKIIASLSGFTPDASISVTFAAGHSNSATASVQGKAVLVLNVPALSYGEHVVYANSSGFSSEAQFTLNSSSIVLSAYGASPGSRLTVYAQGFAAGSDVHLNYNGKSSGQGVKSASNGTASFSFTVPEMTAGRYMMQAVSLAGIVSNLTTLTVRPTLLPSSESVYVGEPLQLTGSYYYPSSTVHVYVGSVLIGGSFESGANGNLDVSVTVPAVPGGLALLGAHDAEGNNATIFSLNILPSITMSKLTASSGSNIRVSGTGFNPGSSLTLLWNGQPMAQVNNVTANGTFDSSISVPSGSPGSYLVTVQNSTAPGIVFNLTGQTGFAVLLPAIILPLATAVVAASYLFVKFRVRKPGR